MEAVRHIVFSLKTKKPYFHRLPVHGTLFRYKKGCRCKDCKTANRDHKRMVKGKNTGRVPKNHGASAYMNYGCRCDVCIAEHSLKCKEYRSKR